MSTCFMMPSSSSARTYVGGEVMGDFRARSGGAAALEGLASLCDAACMVCVLAP